MAKVTGAKFELEYSTVNNAFSIRVWGFYSQEDAQAFISAYDSEIKKFDPQNTYLVIDGTELLTSRPEAKLLLIECMKLYMQLPYKNRLFLKPNSPTAGMMVKSAMKDGGMELGKDGLMLDDLKAIEDYIKTH
ncbi:MAG TPA: hypothetical protein VHT96_10020 [Clostridia bacterium]|nr:hypothetical protein [Clostridia bacterium]